MRRLAPIATMCIVVLIPARAHAGPSDGDVDDFLSYFGLEARGFSALAGGFDHIGVVGGDAHVAMEAAPFGLLLGARLGSNLAETQFAFGDLALRYFPLRSRDVLFVSGGAFYGAEFTRGFGFETGSIGGASCEIGVEAPRTEQTRFVASLRLDFGVGSQADHSTISPPPFAPMASINLGVFFGGKGTALHSPPEEKTTPVEVPLRDSPDSP